MRLYTLDTIDHGGFHILETAFQSLPYCTQHAIFNIAKCSRRIQLTGQQSGFGHHKQVRSVPDPSSYPTRCFLAGQTQTDTSQPTGFAGFG